MFEITEKSLEITRKISIGIQDKTFHHHYHILYDIANHYPHDMEINYVEIGCYAGGSACLLLQRPLTNVYSIDLGKPIPQSVVMENVSRFNIHNNLFKYIKGNSQSPEIVSELKDNLDEIHILFIDGDHSFRGVINDFKNYYPLVNTGGYIIFDDYADYRHSPQVRKAVDYILKNYNGFEIIGAFGNEFGARGECSSKSSESYKRDSNEFVIIKK